MKRRTFQIVAESAGSVLESFLARELSLSLEDARALIARGAVYLQGKRCKQPAARLSEHQRVMAVLEEGGRSALEPSAAPQGPLRVLYEDAELIAVDKPAGLTAQPTPAREGESLLDLVGAHLGRPPGLVHRLDRETSGVTVFGRTRQAVSALASQLRDRTARKRYLAVTGPSLPEAGLIDLPLAPDPARPGRYRALKGAHGAPARTRFVRLHAAEDCCLVSLFPETGRTHQLRAHLAAVGAPIAGDRRYGGQERVAGARAERCLLHAQALCLRHPASGVSLCLEAALPPDMERVWRHFGTPIPYGPWA